MKVSIGRSAFLIIIVLAIFLRFYNLSDVPPSASLDEASIGYNAYSIHKTGVDEYGTKFPILLRAYDDWRPALYVYFVIPFIKLFDLNVVSVRLPSIILSVLTIVATYFLIHELTRKNNTLINTNSLALFTSFLLAISPWHIYISRLGHEVNAGLSFVVFAILFFLKAMNNLNKRFYLFISVVFFGLSLYTYQSEKVFVPLIVLVLGFIYRDSLLKIKKELLISLALAILLIIPIITSTLTPQGLIRFHATSAFSQDPIVYKESAGNVLKYKNEGNILGQIINNRRLITLKIFTANYFSHFNPKFLFFNSGNESFKAPNFGLMYIWEFPFLILGIIFILKKSDMKVKLLLSFWLLIAFIAPSLTTGAPHAMRAFNILPVPQIISALGIFWLINFIKKYKSNRYLLNSFYVLMAFVIIYFLGSFYRQYFYIFPRTQSSSFQYALSKAIPFVLNKRDSYDTIIFSNRENHYQSYMFFLYYSKYDPLLYQKQGGTKSGGYAQTHKFGKYEFRPIVWDKDKLISNTLLVGNYSDFPKQLKSKFFTNLDGKGVIEVVHNRE
jgi:4-amino-4-deoxy-L-arabinose transferase-like glycosyltransferase